MSRRITGLLAVALLAVGAPMVTTGPAAAAVACGAPSPAAPRTTTSTDGFTPLAPVRVLDTRAQDSPRPVAPGCVVTIGLAAVDAVPASATAVALNVTTVDAERRGFVTAFPCDREMPLASNVNPRAGDPTPNLVIVPLDGQRRACLVSSVSTHLVVDVTGYFDATGQPFHATDQQRLLDTRTADRPDGGSGPVPAGRVVQLPVAGQGDVPAGATAAVLNVTVTGAAGPGFAVAYPCGELPSTSTVNFLAGESRADETYVGLDRGGRVCVFTNQTTDLVVDLTGWFGPDGIGPRGQRLAAQLATRVLDTRDPTGRVVGPTPRGDEIAIDLTAGALADDTVAVVLDVVATDTTAAGYTVLYPCGAAVPATSALNQVVGNEATNVVTVAVGADRRVCARTSTPTQLVVDVLATYRAGGPLQDLRVTATETGDAPVLNPPFDPTGLDYTVRCPASGPLDLALVAQSVPGTTVTIVPPGGTPAPGAARRIGASLLPVADDEILVQVHRDTTLVATFGIRCLPSDFPTVHTRTRTTPTPGWFLTGTSFGSTGHFLMILDDRGAVVWYRRVTTPVFDVRRTPEGNVAWAPLLAANQGFGIDPSSTYLEERLDGTQVRSIATVGTPTDHHDLVPLPDDHSLLLTYEKEPGVPVSGAPACVDVAQDVWWSNIQEVDAAGALVWSWKSRDHLAVAATTYLPAQPIPGCDLQHATSLDVTADGDVIVSMSHLDTVLRVRRHPGQPDDGQIVWQLGGASSTFTFLDDPYGGPARQHDARLSADGTLLSLIDNRTDKTGQRARAVVYRLDVANHTARLVFSAPYTAPLTGEPWSGGLGSVRLQPDGHVVVGWGDQTMPQVTEFDQTGAEVLNVDMFDAWSYRTVKVAADAFDRAVLRATAGRR